jgi:VCBS repeat-containing protein
VQETELVWKTYGDTGRTAQGAHGRWVIVTDGAWWYLSLHPHGEQVQGLRRGQFVTRLAAQSTAQDHEDCNCPKHSATT